MCSEFWLKNEIFDLNFQKWDEKNDSYFISLFFHALFKCACWSRTITDCVECFNLNVTMILIAIFLNQIFYLERENIYIRLSIWDIFSTCIWNSISMFRTMPNVSPCNIQSLGDECVWPLENSIIMQTSCAVDAIKFNWDQLNDWPIRARGNTIVLNA